MTNILFKVPGEPWEIKEMEQGLCPEFFPDGTRFLIFEELGDMQMFCDADARKKDLPANVKPAGYRLPVYGPIAGILFNPEAGEPVSVGWDDLDIVENTFLSYEEKDE